MSLDTILAKLFEWFGMFLHWVGALFTPAQWQLFVTEWWNFLLLIVVTGFATQIVKLLWWALPIGGGYRGHINLVAIALGFALAFLFEWNGVNAIIPAIVAGPVSILAFKVFMHLLQKKSPDLAAKVNLNMEAPVKEKADG